jgi:hypothetical protein
MTASLRSMYNRKDATISCVLRDPLFLASANVITHRLDLISLPNFSSL